MTTRSGPANPSGFYPPMTEAERLLLAMSSGPAFECYIRSDSRIHAWGYDRHLQDSLATIKVGSRLLLGSFKSTCEKLSWSTDNALEVVVVEVMKYDQFRVKTVAGEPLKNTLARLPGWILGGPHD